MVTERKLYFDILSNVRKYNGTLTLAKNVELISALPQGEARAIILSWLQSVEDNPPVDFEMVRCAEWVCKSIPSLDEEVMAWIKHRPTELRYEIGLNFIASCWGGEHVASETCLEFVTRAINNDLEKQADAYAYALDALVMVADPVHDMNVTIAKRRELSEKLLPHLAYIEEHHLHPNVVENLIYLRDFETRKFYAIFDKSKDMDMSRLNGYKRAEIVDALLKWLDVWTKPGWFEQDRMWYAGQFMGYALGKGLEQMICDWMKEKPSYGRYEVAIAFLNGYWRLVDVECPDCEEKLRAILLTKPAGV